MKITLEAKAGRGRPLVQDIEKSVVTIGHAADCDFAVVGEGLEFSHVAPHHARIELTPQGAKLSDLGSDKGTWVNGKSVQQPMFVRQGGRFTLGRLGPTITILSLDLTVPVVAPEKRADTAQAGAGKSGSSLKWVALAILLLIAAGGGAAYYYFVLRNFDPARYAGGSGDHFAIVIGLGDYSEEQRLDDAGYAEDDADRLAAALHERGYDVTLMVQSLDDEPHLNALQPTAANIRAKLKSVLSENRELSGGDSVVIAFFGNTVRFAADDSAAAGESVYLCPADANVRGIETNAQVQADSNLIAVSEIYQALAECDAAETRLLYLDTCRSDPDAVASTDARQLTTMPELPTPAGTVTVLTSCGTGEQTFIDPDLGGSASAHFLCRALAGDAEATDGGDGAINLGEVADYVKENTSHHVATYAEGRRQQPGYRGSTDSRGRVIARLSAEKSPPPPPPEPTLPERAKLVLQTHCAGCHKNHEDSEFKDAINHAELIAERDPRFVTPGDVEHSLVWTRMTLPVADGEHMPPEGETQLSGEELDTIREWITAGAAAFGESPIPPPPPPGTIRYAETPAEVQLAEGALDIFDHHCARCHGENASKGGFARATDPASLLSAGKKGHFITPGDPEQSRALVRVLNDSMPQGDEKLSAAEKELLTEWITAGAPMWRPAEVRTPLDLKYGLAAMATYLRDNVRSDDRPHIRFLTLDHLYNESGVTERQLRQVRAAASKVVNSLTWNPDIYVPVAIDQYQTVLAIDLRHYAFDEDDWQRLIEVYPYGLKLEAHRKDREISDLAAEILRLSDAELPFLRADWFVVNVLEPDFYFDFLGLPNTVEELERDLLHVDSEEDFLQARLRRAGFRQSGVSNNNRLLDRHETAIGPDHHGYYWRSYDFKQNNGRGNLELFPLGPDFRENPFADAAFEEDGGEMVFSLPNGLQGYFLINGEGDRIDKGPAEVVKDSSEVSGGFEIVCGLSCFHCHKNGILRDFEDNIFESTALTGHAFNHARNLFPSHEEMKALTAQDEAQFLKALRRATGEFLLSGEDAAQDFDDLLDPIGQVAIRHHGNQSDISLTRAAAELYIAPEELRLLLSHSQAVRNLSLGSLPSEGRVKRQNWESSAGAGQPSIYQQLALEIHGLDPVLP
jgi:mono/diheme cytochrome c family protein